MAYIMYFSYFLAANVTKAAMLFVSILHGLEVLTLNPRP